MTTTKSVTVGSLNGGTALFIFGSDGKRTVASIDYKLINKEAGRAAQEAKKNGVNEFARIKAPDDNDLRKTEAVLLAVFPGMRIFAETYEMLYAPYGTDDDAPYYKITAMAGTTDLQMKECA